jgi:hypothetical protein
VETNACGHNDHPGPAPELRRRIHPSAQRLLAAEHALSIAWQRLNALRRNAFFGGSYDHEEYERALAAYGEAQREFRAAESSWLSRRRTQRAA